MDMVVLCASVWIAGEPVKGAEKKQREKSGASRDFIPLTQQLFSGVVSELSKILLIGCYRYSCR